MSTNAVLRSAAELLSYIYDEIVLCPLPEERELLLSAGNESPETFFHVCRLVLGTNMSIAFRRICIYTSNYCDSLLEHFNEWSQQSDADIIIDTANLKVAAVEYLAQYAPIDFIEEKANLDSLAYQSRCCYNQVLKRYRSYLQSFNSKRT